MKKILIMIAIFICLSGCSIIKSPKNPKKEIISNKDGPFKDHLDTVWYDSNVYRSLEGTKYNDVSVYVPKDNQTLSRYRYVNHDRLIAYDEIVEEWIEKKAQSGSKELHQDYVQKLVMEEIESTGFFYIKETETDPKLRRNAYVSGLIDQNSSSAEASEELAVIEDAFMFENVWLYFFSNTGDIRKLYIPKLVEIVEIGFDTSLSINRRSANREESLRFLKNEFTDPNIAAYLSYKYNISPENFYIHLKDFSDYLEKHKTTINVLREMDEEEFMIFMYIDSEMKGDRSLDVYQRSQMKKYKGLLKAQEILDNMRDFRVFY